MQSKYICRKSCVTEQLHITYQKAYRDSEHRNKGSSLMGLKTYLCHGKYHRTCVYECWLTARSWESYQSTKDTKRWSKETRHNRRTRKKLIRRQCYIEIPDTVTKDSSIITWIRHQYSEAGNDSYKWTPYSSSETHVSNVSLV